MLLCGFQAILSVLACYYAVARLLWVVCMQMQRFSQHSLFLFAYCEVSRVSVVVRVLLSGCQGVLNVLACCYAVVLGDFYANALFLMVWLFTVNFLGCEWLLGCCYAVGKLF